MRAMIKEETIHLLPMVLLAVAAGGCQLLLSDFSVGGDAGDGLDDPDVPEFVDSTTDPDVPIDPDAVLDPDAALDPDVAFDPDMPLDPDVPDEAELPSDPVWVTIPGGTFEMGCSPGDTACDRNEEDAEGLPTHTVNVAAFRITETEITQAQYEWVTGSNPSVFEGCPDCPVDSVTWHEAKAFCEAVGGRLPSEAEWEYVARAGTTTRYYCGDDAACLGAVAWYSANSGSSTHPVGGKTANDFGLYDMLGNVFDWVEDCWHGNYDGAPSTGGVWVGGYCEYRVLRGGSWFTNDEYLRVSYRGRGSPDGRNDGSGLRCAQDAT